MDHEAEAQGQPDEPRVLIQAAAGGYQRVANDDNPRQLNDVRNNKQRTCLIVQGILIAVLFVAFVVLAVGFGVVISIFHTSVNTNTNSSAPHTLSCHQDTEYCLFSRNTTDSGEAVSTCSTNSLSTKAKGYYTTDARCEVTKQGTRYCPALMILYDETGDKKSCYCEMIQKPSGGTPPEATCTGICNLVITRCQEK